VLVVKLEARQWNVLLAGLGELPYKMSAAVMQAVMEQLQASQGPPLNGIDQHPPPLDEQLVGSLHQ
jgi:hypothetical protein